MKIKCFSSGPFSTNAYLVFCEKSREAIIIDPAFDSASLLLEEARFEQLNIKQIWLTHSHWDHFGDLKILKEELKIKVAVHALDAPNVQAPGCDGLPLLMPIEGVKPDVLLEEGQILSFGQYEFRVLHTPGHSFGGVCFYCEKEDILFSGDTLFKGSIGNLSFPTSNEEQMWKSLDKLAKLPSNTQVFPGHGPSTQLYKEAWLSNAKEYFS